MSNHSRFASNDIARLLADNGLCDVDDAFRVGESVEAEHARRATRHRYKQVVKLELLTADGGMTVYIKRQWRRDRLLPRPTDIRHRINLLCCPRHEWQGLRILKQAGFDVSEPLAVFWSGLGLARGAVVTRAVPPKVSIADMLQNGELMALTASRRQALLEAAVDVVKRLSDARIAWRSMKAKHFYPQECPDGSWRIWLIDCEGVYRHATHHDSRREWGTFLQTVTSFESSLRDLLIARYEPVASQRHAA